MEMQQVRYFVALSQTLNFTRAAEQCNVSQPALTRAIKGLEDEFGGPLFHRARANSHLTELGRMVLPHLTQIHDQAQSAKQRAKRLTKLSEATLRIGVMCTIGPERFSGFMRQFRDRHPGVDILMCDGSAAEMSEALMGGELDLALFAKPEGIDEALHALPLFEEAYVICVNRADPLANQKVVRWRELNGRPCCVRAKCEFHDYAAEKLVAMGISAKVVFESEREDWVLEMVRAGMGFAYFPENRVADPEIICIPVIEPTFARAVNLVTVRGQPYSPALGAFVHQAKTFHWVPMAPAGQSMKASHARAM